jgi:hypothetical protein
MEEIRQIQSVGIFINALIWGFLALLISGSYFYCEYKPQSCEKFVLWLRKKFGKKKPNCGLFVAYNLLP